MKTEEFLTSIPDGCTFGRLTGRKADAVMLSHPDMVPVGIVLRSRQSGKTCVVYQGRVIWEPRLDWPAIFDFKPHTE